MRAVQGLGGVSAVEEGSRRVERRGVVRSVGGGEFESVRGEE